uniref:7'-O-demethylcephaeline methyltransferase n=1 Tax=Cinchona pubescens TaxID=50278 RepID=A0A7T8G1S1_9GENT|nr:quinine O-methyltransferase [Cinchona pubescens]
MATSENSTKLLRAQAHIWNQTFIFKNSASLKCAIQLGIPDVIQKHGKPITLSDLISALPINPSKALYIDRLMRILVNNGFLAQEKEGYYTLTSAGRLLLKDDETLSAREFVLMVLDPALVKPWSVLTEWFKNDDRSPFDTAHGKSFWEYMADDPKLGKLFNDAMASDSQLITKVLITECRYVFEELTSLVDVGGGTGTVARSIAKMLPHLNCIVFDLPHVVANQEGTENLDFVAGDMFEKVPPTNAILLKWILHDWSDEDCVKILKNCKKAIPGRDKGGKVIVIDMVMDSQLIKDDESVEAQICFDMEMLVLFRSKERTEKELATLFWDAGFSRYKVLPVLGTRGLIEVYP